MAAKKTARKSKAARVSKKVAKTRARKSQVKKKKAARVKATSSRSTVAKKTRSAKAAKKTAKAKTRAAKAAKKTAKAKTKAAKAAKKTAKAKTRAAKASKKKSSSKSRRAAPPKPTKAGPSRGGSRRSARRTENGAGEAVSVIAEGSLAPSFELLDQDEQPISSDSLKGQAYVLYFYPKDNTPGCTTEACDFRDRLDAFAERDVTVLGVSPDSPKSHAKFREQYNLPFRLISDPEKTLAKAYGVWVKKQNYGREYMGIARSTFLVDRDGKVQKIWRGVSVPGHVGAVYDALDQVS